MFLPEKFVSEEKYDFNGFYKNFLLQMFCDAEKIIIYLIPFVLNIQLKISMLESDEINNQILFKFSGLDVLQMEKNEFIHLICKKMHYEIVYEKDEYENYKNIFNNYTEKKIVILLNIMIEIILMEVKWLMKVQLI